MGGVIIVAVHGSGNDDLKRGLAAFHGPDLYRRCMRAQHAATGNKESILHVPRGMIFGNIEGLEVVIVVFDIRTSSDFKAHAPKDIDDFIDDQGQRMRSPPLPTRS